MLQYSYFIKINIKQGVARRSLMVHFPQFPSGHPSPASRPDCRKHIACTPEPAEEQVHFQTWCLKTVPFRASSGRESSLSHCCFSCDDAAPRCSPPSVCFTVPSGFWQHAEVKTRVISLIYFLPQILMSTSGHQKYLSLMAVLPRIGLCTELNFLSHSTLASQGLLSHLGKIYKDYS